MVTMETPQKFAVAHNNSSTSSHRLTIGLLSEELFFSNPADFFRGVKEATEQYDVNLLHVASSALRSPQEFQIQSNIFFDMIGPENVDALLIASNLLSGYAPFEEFKALCHSYGHLPIVSLGLAIDDIPSVVLDNASGMYEVVSHLIETHGYRRIAYINGPEEHPDAQERYQAYAKALADHHIPIDPALVLPGDFQQSSAVRAIGMLLDEREQQPGRDVEAIVTANDYMAMAAIEELQDRGIRVPEDLAVAGFAVRCITPPLTTVQAPFFEVGRHAMELLMATMAGETVPEKTAVPARAVIRHSC
jgi:DNA-binding LacI/PurR family transcriptional regulator